MDKAEKYVGAAWQMSRHPDLADHLAQIYEKEGKTGEAIRMFALALSGDNPNPEIKGRMTALEGGDDKKVEAAVAQHRPELHKMDEFKLNVPSPGIMKADYFLLFGVNGSVNGVRFVSGDEKLKALAEALRGLPFGVSYPDDSPVKLLRRGTLACSGPLDESPAPRLGRKHTKKAAASSVAQPGTCLFNLQPADDVRSID
jgi:hypothetical protein